MDEDGELVLGGIAAQTRHATESFVSALGTAGCTLDDVVKVDVWLDDPRDFWTSDGVCASSDGHAPVRSKLTIDAEVEIDRATHWATSA